MSTPVDVTFLLTAPAILIDIPIVTLIVLQAVLVTGFKPTSGQVASTKR